MAKITHTKAAPAEKPGAEEKKAAPLTRNDMALAILCHMANGQAHNVSENAAENKTLVRKAFALADAFLA